MAYTVDWVSRASNADRQRRYQARQRRRWYAARRFAKAYDRLCRALRSPTARARYDARLARLWAAAWRRAAAL